jgi:membrane-bound ClpP family serine protease
MTALLLLFLIGILLLAADVFVTSIVLAVLGSIAMVAGCVQAFREFGAVGAVVSGLAASLLLGITIYIELVVLPKTRFGRGLVVHSTAGSKSQPPLANAEDVVGKTAEALTVLAPSGYVIVSGRRYEAFCRSGHIAKGDQLRVVGVDNFRLIVSKT